MYLFLCSCRSLRELRKPYNREEELVESVSSTILAATGVRGHVKILADGQLDVPAGGHVEVLTPR